MLLIAKAVRDVSCKSHLDTRQEAVLYKYEDSEFPHALDIRANMYGDQICSSSNVAVGVTFRYIHGPIRSCVVPL